MEFRAKTSIDAPADRVWEILMDTAKWPEWDPSCERIEGEVAPGAKLTAYSTLSPGRGFGLKVTELVPNRRMVWAGGMPLGLFKGVRTFELAEDGTFEVHERFSGPMLFLIKGSLPDMGEAFEGFCAGLKARAEAS